MKVRRQADWSFLLMRGAEHSVKQFKVKKRSLIATPVALLAIVSGCFIGMKLQATSQIKDLELQLAQLNNQYIEASEMYNASISAHQLSISTLEQQLEVAYDKQKKIDEKLLELTELEKQLEHFISTYGSQSSVELDRDTKQSQFITEDNKISLTELVYHFDHEQSNSNNEHNKPTFTIAQLNYDQNQSKKNSSIVSSEAANYAMLHELPIEQLSQVVDNFVEVMHYNLHKAGKIRESVDSFPNFWPSSAKMTTSGFGYRIDPFTKTYRFHAGIDIDGKNGDVIFSAGDGTVIEASYHASYGHYIIIKHTDSLKTLYGHLSSIDAKKGDNVVKGEKIGKMGSTGRSTGTHLHFQVMLNEHPVSPIKYIIKPN